MYIKILLSLICFFLFSINSSIAQDFKYVGASKCKMCHNKEEKGAQYSKWKETRHSKAMESLSSEKAMKYAQENGIEDPAKEPKCMKCHSTAAGADPSLLTEYITVEEGVSCESCHGPGSAYKSKLVMKDREESTAKGLIIPTEEVCVKCHNEKDNPFFKPFNFEERVKKIAHPMPDVAAE